MSLPVLHSIVGMSIVVICYPRNSLVKDWRFLLLGTGISLLPDLDYLLVYGLDMSHEYHRSFSHSIFFAFIVTLSGLMITKFTYIKKTLVCGAILLSHGIVDFLVSYEKGGVQLLYPLSDKRFVFHISSIFERMNNSFTEFTSQASIELIFFTPFLLLLLLVREYRANGAVMENDNYQTD